MLVQPQSLIVEEFRKLMPSPVPCIFGEVLYDNFPGGERVLGGAPFNVAWHLQAFGATPRFFSRVGEDDEGRSILQAMKAWGMDTTHVGTDNAHDSGRVEVQFNDNEPSYHIVPDCAYDHITVSGESVGSCGLLYHGTLALRNSVSRDTLARLKKEDLPMVFLDVNLRDPWWSTELVEASLNDAHWVKLNEHELDRLHGTGGGPLESRAVRFLQHHALKTLVVTRGSRGAVAFSDDGDAVEVIPSRTLEVVDTVGAGDAFTSILILGILEGWPLKTTMKRAQQFAEKVVGQQGATQRDRSLYAALCNDWGWGVK